MLLREAHSLERVLLNRLEYALMNNPLRAALQRRYEARKLLAMGGQVGGGLALEIGCGRGVGLEVVLDLFGARRVEGFDLDPRMVRLAERRTRGRGGRVATWVGDATAIPVADDRYDAVFDFGILHHVPRWRDAVREVSRVLKPCGRFYAEEVLASFLGRFPWRGLFDHPREDRFDQVAFTDELTAAGFRVLDSKELHDDFAWFVAEKTPYTDIRT